MVIEDEEVIKKILKHLSLWEIKERPPPKAKQIGPRDSSTRISSIFGYSGKIKPLIYSQPAFSPWYLPP